VIERMLLAVDDSPDSLRAARAAIELAKTLHARLRIVHVRADHLVDAAVEAASGRPEVGARRAQSGAAILTRVALMAGAAGVVTETDLLVGDAGPMIVNAARVWQADLIVAGRSARSTTGSAADA